MAEHVWSVLCYKGVIDEESKSISLLDVIEKLEIGVRRRDFPPPSEKAVKLVRVQSEVVSWWVRSNYKVPETLTVRFTHLAPDGSNLGAKELPLDLTKHIGQRVKFQIGSFPINRGSGVFWFVIEERRGRKWVQVARIPVELVLEIVDDPPQPAQEGG